MSGILALLPVAAVGKVDGIYFLIEGVRSLLSSPASGSMGEYSCGASTIFLRLKAESCF